MLYYITLLQSFLTKPLRKEGDKGATAVEYGLMLAAVVAIIIATAFLVGEYVFDAFEDTRLAWFNEKGAPAGPPAAP